MMFGTTVLMYMVMLMIWETNFFLATAFLIGFGFIDMVFTTGKDAIVQCSHCSVRCILTHCRCVCTACSAPSLLCMFHTGQLMGPHQASVTARPQSSKHMQHLVSGICSYVDLGGLD